MKQDLIRLTVVSLSLGVIVWAIYGNPESRAHTAQSVRADSSLSSLPLAFLHQKGWVSSSKHAG
jgi:hypothetical protein